MKTQVEFFRNMIKDGPSQSRNVLVAWLLVHCSGLLSQQVTLTYTANGSFTVPACVSAVSFTVKGAKGGEGYGYINQGGNGGMVIGQFTVVQGQAFQVRVGAAGGDVLSYCPPGGPCTSTPGAGGYNGGGDGSYETIMSGSGGGGASDIRVAPFTLNDRIVVAGGGGGAGSWSSNVNEQKGGDGGGLSGENGYQNSYTQAGFGGSQTSGGSGGSTVTPASTGAFGIGGIGVSNTAGGGGGGGWFGGGGGRYGGGGGGSNYTAPFITAVTHSRGANAAGGLVIINYHIGSIGNINTTYPAVCSGGSLTLSAPQGLTSYTWNTTANTQSITITPTISQTYSFAGSMANGCTATGSILIVASAGQPTLAIGASTTEICPGKAVSLTAGGAVTYTWSNGITSGVPFYPTTTNSYVVYGQNGCGTSSAAITISVAPLSVTISANTQTVCAGTAVVLTAVPSLGNYSWTPHSSGIFTNSVYLVVPPVTTAYSLSASDGTCNAYATYTVQVLPVPVITITASGNNVCAGNPVTLVASGAASYSWMLTGSSGSLAVVSPTSSTQYFVAGTNSSGCASSSSCFITTKPIPIITISVSANKLCAGNQATLIAGGANSYTWAGGPSGSSYQVTPVVTSVYMVAGTNSFSCTATRVVTIQVHSPTLAVSMSSPVCLGKTLVLSAGAADSYSWNGVPGGATYTSYPLQNTIYTVAVISTSLGLSCIINQTVYVQPAQNPTLTVAGMMAYFCKGDPVELMVNGASSYTWIASPGQYTGNGATINVPSTNAGTSNYTITGINPAGCESSTIVSCQIDECAGFRTVKPDQLFTVYPNPASETLRIISKKQVTLSVYDPAGRLLRIMDVSPGKIHEIPPKTFAPGIYFIVNSGEPGAHLKLVISD